MPTTRSMKSLSSLTGRAVTSSPPQAATTIATPTQKTKRKAQDTTDASSQNSKKARLFASPGSTALLAPNAEANEILPAKLTFSFEIAKQHLISVDSRFGGVFSKLPCRPFEQLERVDPFRTLATSILGQQISWLAARSIRHRFVRLYDQSLPEKAPADHSDEAEAIKDIFPTAGQVVDTDITTLKSAGLSTRKAEYIKDLAARFADGRLTNKKLVEADDEELARLLIEVRGIGRWTVDMFAMFSLRRPDILPVGDLGVQRGVIRWFLSLHSPLDAVTISDKKLPKTPSGSQKITNEVKEDTGDDFKSPPPLLTSNSEAAVDGVLSLPSVPVTPVKGKGKVSTPSQSPDKTVSDIGSMPMLPEPFTPSINKILNPNAEADMEVEGTDVTTADGQSLAPLPEDLTVAVLKSRLNGKKKIKGALLTPKEMEALTDPWRPFRSLGVYYMWALAEDKK